MSRVGRGKRDRFTVAGRKLPKFVEFRYPRKEHVKETHSATFLQTDVSVCARGAFTFTMACRRERSFRVFTIEIHERENKKKCLRAANNVAQLRS